MSRNYLELQRARWEKTALCVGLDIDPTKVPGRIAPFVFLEIIIEESLVVVTFATVVLTVYVFGIRTIGDWATHRYGVKPGLIEALLILALALFAAPFRGWLARRFQKLFERETALYKQIVSRIGSYTAQYKDLVDLLHFV